MMIFIRTLGTPWCTLIGLTGDSMSSSADFYRDNAWCSRAAATQSWILIGSGAGSGGIAPEARDF